MFEIFAPVPRDYRRTDDDCAAVTWQRGRKLMTIMLNCYGSAPTIRCGLCNPPGGTIIASSLEVAWEWYCEDKDELLKE